jgi:hypothetical protein
MFWMQRVAGAEVGEIFVWRLRFAGSAVELTVVGTLRTASAAHLAKLHLPSPCTPPPRRLLQVVHI